MNMREWDYKSWNAYLPFICDNFPQSQTSKSPDERFPQTQAPQKPAQDIITVVSIHVETVVLITREKK